MAEKLVRTSFKEPSGAERQGSTALKESRVDVERYVQPLLRVHGSGLHDGGVAAGLAVSATQGGAEVRVAAGVAVDAPGRHISLAVGGFAKLDDLTLVKVEESGVGIPTGAGGGTFVVTIGWAETFDKAAFQANGVFQLLETPVIRLRPAAAFVDDGAEVVLAQAQLDGTGAVTALSVGGRRAAGISVENLTFSGPQITTTGQTSTVHHIPYTELRTHPDGGLRLSDLDAGADRVVLDAAGNIGIGLGATKPERTLHVEGREIHSGGPAGGFSFADRDVEEFVEDPDAGQRWIWYAQNGTARLRSGNTDLLTIGTAKGAALGLDVARRMRVRRGAEANEPSAGIWFNQSIAERPGDSAFVGLVDETHVGFWGQHAQRWGFSMDTTTGAITVNPTPNFTGIAANVVGQTELRGHTTVLQGLTVRVPVFALQPAAEFFGRVAVRGNLEKAGGSFKIDHPLDPANRYLSHSFVESPEMLNIYCGVTCTDDDGRAEVAMPDYFEALNRDFSYQLTSIGTAAQVFVIAEIENNTFVIGSDQPQVNVSWMVTGVRQDAWANANRVPVEEDKPADECGHYLHPVEHNQPQDREIPSSTPSAGGRAGESFDT